MGFVTHWYESAMDLHVFPIPIPPPTSLSTQSPWVFPVLQAWALASWIMPFLNCFFQSISFHNFLLSLKYEKNSLSCKHFLQFFFYHSQCSHLIFISYLLLSSLQLLDQVPITLSDTWYVCSKYELMINLYLPMLWFLFSPHPHCYGGRKHCILRSCPWFCGNVQTNIQVDIMAEILYPADFFQNQSCSSYIFVSWDLAIPVSKHTGYYHWLHIWTLLKLYY